MSRVFGPRGQEGDDFALPHGPTARRGGVTAIVAITRVAVWLHALGPRASGNRGTKDVDEDRRPRRPAAHRPKQGETTHHQCRRRSNVGRSAARVWQLSRTNHQGASPYHRPRKSDAPMACSKEISSLGAPAATDAAKLAIVLVCLGSRARGTRAVALSDLHRILPAPPVSRSIFYIEK